MAPTLKHGDRIVAAGVEPEALRPGDLILYDNGRERLCQRLVRRTGRLLIVRGDARWTVEPPVAPAQVLGRVDTFVDHDLHIRDVAAIRFRRASWLYLRFGPLLALGGAIVRSLGRIHPSHRWIEFD